MENLVEQEQNTPEGKKDFIESCSEEQQAAAERPVLKIIKKAAKAGCQLVFILLLSVMVFLVFTLVQTRLTEGPPSILGYQMYIVKGGSMSPAFEAGSLILLQPVEAEDISIGEIITYSSPGSETGLTTHRVMEINRAGERLSFTTRGDANLVDDHAPVSPEQLKGKVVYAVPYAGFLMNFAQTRNGIITLVFIPGALIIALELRNLYYYSGLWEEEKKREREIKEKEQGAPVEQ